MTRKNKRKDNYRPTNKEFFKFANSGIFWTFTVLANNQEYRSFHQQNTIIYQR
jgi:hypothetical protein